MKNEKDCLCLRQVFLRMLLYRLYIPLIFLGLIIVVGVGYLGIKDLRSHQNQVAVSMSHIVDYHLEQGGKILNAVANVAETSTEEELPVFMRSAWEAYGYFETIYYLDKDNKIELMMPHVSRYAGIDMSNLPNIKENAGLTRISISRPFISLRTGNPTVYLIRPLPKGGAIIGELNLGLFQQEVVNTLNTADIDFTFIMDQTGMLLAHPSSKLVRQQTNMSNLEIFRNAADGKASEIYSYNGRVVVGSAVKLDRTGWIIVDQSSLSSFGKYYAWALVGAFLASLVIWQTLVSNLRKQLQKYVITPLEQLTESTNALTVGNYIEANFSSSIPTSFTELDKLIVDFQFMTNNLQTREVELKESEKRYRGLISRIPIGFFRTTLTGEILGVNPMLELILGYSDKKQLLKSNIIDFLHEASIDKEREQVKIENMSNLRRFEIQIKCYNGKIKWVQIDSYIVNNSENQEEFLEGSIQDITERKKSEEKVKEQQELLITVEREKREALEKSLVMKDEFISLISHEFKTPLNVIYSAVQLIECVYFNKIPSRVQELMGNIKQNTFRQLRLANNLLDITRMTSGDVKLNERNIDIVSLSKTIVNSAEIYANQKNIEVSFKSNVESEIVSLDEEKYEKIILNLISNAMKFTESEGQINVILFVNKELNVVEIKVLDTGVGIPKDKQELIFERFGQVENNLSRQAEGAGIGLFIVKLLVDILGGTIEVESQVGIGSTFIITLPIKKEEVNNEFVVNLDVDNKLINEIRVEFSDVYL